MRINLKYFTLLVVLSSFFIITGCKAPKNKTPKAENPEVSRILSRISLPNIRDTAYAITDFGAVGDGKFDCRPAIDSAIRICSQNGGGKIVVAGGTYYCKGPIHLESNINLHVNEDAVILFSQDPADYLPLKLVRWEGVEIYNYSPFIYALNKKNIAITGRGGFDGNATGGLAEWRKKQKPAQLLLRKMGNDLEPVKERLFGEGHFLRPSFMQFLHCSTIFISDITIENVPFWVVHPTFCRNITIRGIRVNSLYINNDGIDLDSDEDVLVEGCRFTCGDDAIAIKSGRDNDGRRINRPSRNIVIRNCIADKVLHGMAFGSEMSAGVENVYVNNFTMKNVDRYAVQFKANKDRGGYIRNIYLNGIHIDTAQTAIFFTNNYHGYRGGEFPSEFHHITVKNLTCNFTRKEAFKIIGLQEKPIHNVILDNVVVTGQGKESKILFVRDFTYNNVTVNGKKLLNAAQ
jgi:polygalacturonase